MDVERISKPLFLLRYLEHQPRVDLVVQFPVVFEEGVDYSKAVICTC